MDEKSRKRRRAKRQQWMRAFAREYGLEIRQLLVGFLMSVVLPAVILIVVLIRWGMDWGEIADEAFVQRAALVAAALVLAVSAVVSFGVNALRAGVRVAEDGCWFGDHFVYRSPKVVAVYKIDASETPFYAELKLAEVPVDALVYCHAALSPENEHWTVSVLPKGWKLNLGFHRPSRFSGAMLGKDRTLGVSADVSRKDATPIVVRIMLESWESQ
jgi:hypothetical protein